MNKLKSILVFFFIVNLSCASDGKNSRTSSKTQEDLKPQKACEAFANTLLGETLGWKPSDINSAEMGHVDRKRSICRFESKGEILWVRLAWKSDRAVEMKTLENQFKGYLENGENGISYQSLNEDTLLGEKPADGINSKLYIFRKRYGNTAEVTFEYYSDKPDKAVIIRHFEVLISQL